MEKSPFSCCISSHEYVLAFKIGFNVLIKEGYDGWFPGSEGFGYEIDEEAGTITFMLEDLSPMEYYLGIGWNNCTDDESYHTKTMSVGFFFIYKKLYSPRLLVRPPSLAPQKEKRPANLSISPFVTS